MNRQPRLAKLYLILIMILLYLPIVVVMIYSFNASKITSVWGGWSLKWYAAMFEDRDLFQALKNSIVLACLSSLTAGVIGTLGAIGIRRSKLALGDQIEYVAMLPIMIPEIILGMLFMGFFSLLGLPFGMTTLVIAHSTFCIPYVYTMVKGRLSSIDPHLQEAARDLGASEVQVLTTVMMPQLTPSIISGMLLAFAMSFDDVIISLFVTGVNTNTLPIKIYSQLKMGVAPEINALCTLLICATAIILIFAALLLRKQQRLSAVQEKSL